jgi:hypothetical protein
LRDARARGAVPESVVVRPIVMVWGEPVFPLLKRKARAPRGVFGS